MILGIIVWALVLMGFCLINEVKGQDTKAP